MPDRTPATLARIGQAVAQGASLVRLHIVAIAGLGTCTFGWLLVRQSLGLVAALAAADWFVVNLLNRLVDRTEDEINGVVAAPLVRRHPRALWAIGVAFGLGTLLVGGWLLPALVPWRLAYHALGLAYNGLLPGVRRRLKPLYLAKNVASATGFLLTVFAYPLVAAGGALAPGITAATVALAMAFFFFFELSYEILYDFRDIAGDRAAHVRTLPVVHGPRVTARVVDALLGGSVAILALGYVTGVVPWGLFIMATAPVIQFVWFHVALRRGITSGDCVGLTWLGAALLVGYHLWIHLGLPGSEGLR